MVNCHPEFYFRLPFGVTISTPILNARYLFRSVLHTAIIGTSAPHMLFEGQSAAQILFVLQFATQTLVPHVGEFELQLVPQLLPQLLPQS